MTVNTSRERSYLISQLADRIDAHPVREWSDGLIRIVIASLDAYIGEELKDRPAPVLELVRNQSG